MNQHYRGCLGALAYKKRILVFDDDTVILRNHPDLLEPFEIYNCYAAGSMSEEHLGAILTSWKPDVVVVESSNPEHTIRLCRHITQFDWKIALVVVVPEGSIVPDYREANALTDTMLCRPAPDEVLLRKIVTAMAAKQTLIQLSHSLNLENLLNDTSDIDTFKVTFEGHILVLCESLVELSHRLKDGELSKELFDELSDSMETISQIFGHHLYTRHVSVIFEDLGDYLRNFDFDTIDISTLEGFDYLVSIVDDIIHYVRNFFVNRIFSDVYVFEHSLKNSIEFMKNRLENREDNTSVLEFF